MKKLKLAVFILLSGMGINLSAEIVEGVSITRLQRNQ